MMAAERWRDGAAQPSVLRLVGASPLEVTESPHAFCRRSTFPSASSSANRRSGSSHQWKSVSACWQRGQMAAASGSGSRLML